MALELTDLSDEPAEPAVSMPEPYPGLDAMRAFMIPWMRTREAYGPVWWPEFRRLADANIDRTQFNLMRVIAHAPPRPLKDLAAAATLTSSTASRLVESLVIEGLVERVVPHDDRRVTLIRASEAGRQLIEFSEHVGASLLAGPFETFDADEIRVFTDVFQRLAPIVERWAGDSDAWREDAARRRREAPASG